MIKLATRAARLELSPTLAANEKVLALREAGKTILHMGFGEAPFPVPERLRDALKKAAHRKDYLPTGGLPALRTAVIHYYRDKIGLCSEEYDVLIAPGSKLILYALQMAIEGDLLLPVPSWVSYGPQADMLKTQTIPFATRLGEDGMAIDPARLRETISAARAQGLNPSKLILNSPSNPTGLVYGGQNLKEIAQVCMDEDIFIISDEIYGFVTFDGTYRTISAFAPEITGVSTGLSKHLSLGGWRIGVGLIPKSVPGLYALLCQIASETWSCVPAPIQQAAMTAFEGHADIEEHITACTKIHSLMNEYISSALVKLNLCPRTTQGAFYSYPDFEPYRTRLAEMGIMSSDDLADTLLERYGLVALPGSAFGERDGALTLRLSGCDYDGAKALAAFQNGAPLDGAFIKAFAPNITAQVEAFEDFVEALN